jgi:MerR family transcriptional regulator, copper efflux regulator
MREEPELREAVDAYFQLVPDRPEHVAPSDWLRWEQEKHERLLALAAA